MKLQLSRRPWLIVVLVVVVGIGAYLTLRPAGMPTVGATAEVAEIPTVTVKTGPVEQAIRVTGTTQAERYAGILAPRLGGSRGGYGR